MDPEDPAWREPLGHIAELVTVTTPLETVQVLIGCLDALYNLQVLRHASVHDLSQQLFVAYTHLHQIAVAYQQQEVHLAQAQQDVGRVW